MRKIRKARTVIRLRHSSISALKQKKHIRTALTDLLPKERELYYERTIDKNKLPTDARRTNKEQTLDEETRMDIAARMLALGFEPHDIRKTLVEVPIGKIRKWIKSDPDFRVAIEGYEQEIFGALESKYKTILFTALKRLEEIVEVPEDKKYNPKYIELSLEAIDKVFRIHGKYIERTEDMTPPVRKSTPEQAERLLDKGIELLKLTREQKQIEGATIEIGKESKKHHRSDGEGS